MSVVAKESVPALLRRRWRDAAAWSTTSDIFAILIAVSLPWSTTLVAIFAADVEGYSRLMGTDEVGTMRELTRRRAILDGLIASCRGRIGLPIPPGIAC